MTNRKLSLNVSLDTGAADWSEATTEVDLSPEMVEIIESARKRARAKRLSQPAPQADAHPESGVVPAARKLPPGDV